MVSVGTYKGFQMYADTAMLGWVIHFQREGEETLWNTRRFPCSTVTKAIAEAKRQIRTLLAHEKTEKGK